MDLDVEPREWSRARDGAKELAKLFGERDGGANGRVNRAAGDVDGIRHEFSVESKKH